MKIGPVDIRNHSFKKKMNGFDEEEVAAFLELIADRLEEEILGTEDLRAQIDRMESRIAEYETLEKSLRNSLVSAEQLADERLSTAEKESRIIVKNAEVEGEKIVLRARSEYAKLRSEIDDLKRQKLTYVERFRALLRSQFKILEASLQTFDPDREEDTESLLSGGGLDDGESTGIGEDLSGAAGKDGVGAGDALSSYLGEEGLFANPPKNQKKKRGATP